MEPIIITREIIREKAMSCSFVRPAKAARVTARFSAGNGSVGCSSTTTARPHEFFDPTGLICKTRVTIDRIVTFDSTALLERPAEVSQHLQCQQIDAEQ